MRILVMLWVGIPALTAMPFAAQNGIINVILGGLLVLAETFVICRTKLNETLRKPVIYATAISLVLTSAVSVSFIANVVAMYILPNTNSAVVSAVFTFAALYMAVSGRKTVGRTAEILFCVCILNVGFALFSAVGEIGFIVGKINISDILKSACAFGGVQILYVLLPETEGGEIEKKAFTATSFAVATVIIFTMISMGRFGIEDMSNRNFAIYNIMDSVRFPILFGDRHDLFMLRTGLFGGFVAVGEGMFFAGNVFTEKKYLKPVMAVIIFVISLFAEIELLWFTGIISIIIFGIVLPIIAWRVRK